MKLPSRSQRALALAAGGLLFLSMPVTARPDASGKPEMPVKMPSPMVLLDKEAISIGVVSARLEDEGVRSMLKTAWTTVQTSGLSPGNIFSFLTGMLSQSTQQNLLLDMLPVQAVRVVYADAQGRQSSAFMVTMEGYQGFQGMYWPTLLIDPSGKPYPLKSSKDHTFVIRPKPGQDSNQASAVIRLDGTFYAFPDVARGQRVLEGHPTPPEEILEMLGTVDQHQDSYGVMINRNKSLETFFEWINATDYKQVQAGVGAQKLSSTLDSVESLAWQGDLISDDQMNMQIRFRSDTPAHAQELADVLRQTRHILRDVGRAGELQMTVVESDVLLQVEMVGYRAMLINYLRYGKS